MGISKSTCPFPYGDSLYGNGDGSFGQPLSHALKCIFLIFFAQKLRFSRISIWGTNGHPHMEVGIPINPHFHMGKQMEWMSRWRSHRNGSPFLNKDGSVTNPFPNRVCAHLGIEVKITIWECFPYGDHHFHMVITVQKWAGRLKCSHMGSPRFRIEFVSILGLTYTPYAYLQGDGWMDGRTDGRTHGRIQG